MRSVHSELEQVSVRRLQVTPLLGENRDAESPYRLKARSASRLPKTFLVAS
jgi:hypothetical protein